MTEQDNKCETCKNVELLKSSQLEQTKIMYDKILLQLEILIVFLGCAFLLLCVCVASFLQIVDWLKIVLIVLGVVVFVPTCLVALKIEQIAGFYVCKKCGKKYVPTYKQVSLAIHVGRTRYMKCSHCNKNSWCKKVVK